MCLCVQQVSSLNGFIQLLSYLSKECPENLCPQSEMVFASDCCSPHWPLGGALESDVFSAVNSQRVEKFQAAEQSSRVLLDFRALTGPS